VFTASIDITPKFNQTIINMSTAPIKTAIIIGAGPAGLTAAYELLKRTNIKPVILERSEYIGGISKTVNYKGNRIDIGGHRFFSKSDRVMDWWLSMFPVKAEGESVFSISYQNKTRQVNGSLYNSAGNGDKVMLVRERLSRIYYLKKFFNYPISLSLQTLKNLGPLKVMKIGYSYMMAQFMPKKKEQTLEDFFINRFGKELYLTFFKDYTEKVWGVSCDKISSDWGAQRIKKLTIGKAVLHAVKASMNGKANKKSIEQKDVETSLIERFLYPKLGPGQLWEEVAEKIKQLGGEIHHNCDVVSFSHDYNNISSVTVTDTITGEKKEFSGDYFFSTMPVKNLVAGMNPAVPANIREVANGLVYRDFITVGLLLKELKLKDAHHKNGLIKDNWIYIQERDVKIGRLQVFNNWSPHMVAEPGNVWIGLEYFCNEGDELWQMPDDKFIEFAINELVKIEIIDKDKVLDSTILREKKTYPAYFGTYNRFDEIRSYLDRFENLFLIGRNGMHKYNNSDHSMLTAMTAVDNIIIGETSKDNIWSINTEQEYHEKKKVA